MKVLQRAAPLLSCMLLLAGGCREPMSTAPAELRFDPAGNSSLRLGTTHTQYSADPWGDPQAVARATHWLSAHPLLQNQHLMGWGAGNPEPSPGQYDWTTLDRRMALIRQTRGVPVLTLCCAPDWMKGGRAGETDWSRLAVAPLREHFADFAELARQAALRYPDVQYFQVWNELKGFFDPAKNRWDYEAYTDLYNRVYDAVRSVRPAAKIGGPYVVMDSWSSADAMSHPSSVRGSWGVLDQRALDAVRHWLEHKHGADFLTVDLGTGTRDAGLITDAFTATEKYRAVIDWLRGQTTLPVWLAEWYAGTGEAEPGYEAAVMATALVEQAKAGLSVALQWGPQADGEQCVGGCLWSDTRLAGGGGPTPLSTAFSLFQGAFPPGTPLFAVAGLADVTALASPRHILLVNRLPARRSLRLGARTITLGPWEIALIDRS